MQQKDNRADAVSEVVGEMLMLAMVLLLLAVLSSTLGNFLPVDRDPSVTMLVSSNNSAVTLWHKGGDWVKTTDMIVIIGNETASRRFTAGQFTMDPERSVFDLGGSLSVPFNVSGDEVVRVVAGRSVIFTGEVA